MEEPLSFLFVEVWLFSKKNEMHNFFESPICMENERIKNPKHPTQKPMKYLEYIIKIASSFCSFYRVSRTAIASFNLNRRFLGIEVDNEYCQATKLRINNLNKYK